MGVYVKGMEMPKDCIVCPFGWNGCNKQHDFVYMGSRPDNCPLVPVPEPHGRLIDASEVITVQVYEDQYEDYRSVSMTIDDLLSGQGWIDADAPTIIEAEEGK